MTFKPFLKEMSRQKVLGDGNKGDNEEKSAFFPTAFIQQSLTVNSQKVFFSKIFFLN